jgi:hypothetical protein
MSKQLRKQTQVMPQEEVITLASIESKPKYSSQDFLAKKIVRVVPIETRTFTNQQIEQLPEGFIHEGMGRSLELKRDRTTGEFLPIFDNIENVISPQFPDEPMTELEFFSKITGYDLSFSKDTKNFWSGWISEGPNNRGKLPYSVKLPKEGLTLDLSNAWDNITWRVLKTNDRYVAPSWELRNAKPTYWFALVDERISVDLKKEEINLKLKATEEFNRIKDHREILMEFMIIKDPNNIISKTASTDFLFNLVYEVMETNPKLFLSIVNDEYREDKILIFKAVRAGILKKISTKYFTMGDEPLGVLGDVISLINNPEKLEFRKKLEFQVENSNL